MLLLLIDLRYLWSHDSRLQRAYWILQLLSRAMLVDHSMFTNMIAVISECKFKDKIENPHSM